MAMRFAAVLLGLVVGGTVGGFCGWWLGDFGGRSDPENVWFLSMVLGGGVGLALAIALVLPREKGSSWGSPILIGVTSATVAVVAFVLFTILQRRP